MELSFILMTIYYVGALLNHHLATSETQTAEHLIYYCPINQRWQRESHST